MVTRMRKTSPAANNEVFRSPAAPQITDAPTAATTPILRPSCLRCKSTSWLRLPCGLQLAAFVVVVMLLRALDSRSVSSLVAGAPSTAGLNEQTVGGPVREVGLLGISEWRVGVVL